ncbi:hypothetical protein [Hyphomonas sp. BRH_c22]|uniref:glucosamine inositolphosphorylceramide transferase family protein n=1 Tax=Hyphomonas sp. BRH_c22 TaxID=1629710 RepID=UPI00260EE3C2|nr:hypothetical protein [Hyphomonas sp. BRH_c22]
MQPDDHRRLSQTVAVRIDAHRRVEAWQAELIDEILRVPGVSLAFIAAQNCQEGPAHLSIQDRLAFGIDQVLFGIDEGAAIGWTQFCARQNLRLLTAEACEADRLAGVSACAVDVLIDLATPARTLEHSMPGPINETWTYNFLRDAMGCEGFGMKAAASPGGVFFIDLIRQGDRRVLATGTCGAKVSAVRNLRQARRVATALTTRELASRSLRIDASSSSLTDSRAKDPAHTDALVHLINVGRWGTKKLASAASAPIALSTGKMKPEFRLVKASGTPLTFDPARTAETGTYGNYFLADPFLHAKDGKLTLFCEVYDYRLGRGYIGAADMSTGQPGEIVPVLDDPVHYSFPYVYEHDGETYMMPETASRNRIEVWRCIDFPVRWELVSTALDGQMPVDSAICWYEGRWWLFTSLARTHLGEHSTELYLFEADGPLLENLRPHVRNPIVIDARFARNGGRIFQEGGKLYRPSQSNRYGIYGYGLNIMEIAVLNPDQYTERPVRFFEGAHHIDSADGTVILDARQSVQTLKEGDVEERALT